jgi:hypothetical protein
MTALLKDRSARFKKIEGIDLPVAAGKKIYKGAFCVLSAGYLEPGETATGLTLVGRASTQVDNTDGTIGGEEMCHVDFLKEKTMFPFVGYNGEFAQANVGGVAYLKDDQTVTTTSAGATAAGTVWRLETANSIQTVWVEV